MKSKFVSGLAVVGVIVVGCFGFMVNVRHHVSGQEAKVGTAGMAAPVPVFTGSTGTFVTCNAYSDRVAVIDRTGYQLNFCDFSGNGIWNQVGLGSTGPAGATGATGNTGLTGSAGVTGAQGSTGAQGVTGTAGTTGSQGSTGATGSTGQTGSVGATGTAGTNGTNGTNGATGPTGSTGVTGTTGTNATSYLSGTSGTITGTLLAVGGTDTGTLTVTGASVGMPCTADTTDGTNPSSSVAITCRVTGANTVTVILTGFAIATPASKAYNVRVFP